GRHMDDCCPENDGKYSFRFWVHNNGTYHVYENLIIRPGPSYWGERYDHFSGKECYKMIENILGLYAKTVFRTPKSEGDWELVCRDSWGYCALKNRTPKSPEQRM
ncbi:MAG: hypothetical protein KDD62_12310, partial [Bdellovibrionales bacterium]|nr:hypothetical protein [Bdellovibrionales bacterium]